MQAKGPKGHFLFGAGVAFKNDPLRFLVETAEQYPDISTFRFGPNRTHLLSNPLYVKHVLQKNYKNYIKGPKKKDLKHFWGNSLSITDGEEWRQQRKMSQPAFSPEKIEQMAETMLACTHDFVEKWRKNKMGKEIEMVSEMTELALNIIGKSLFSKDLSPISKRVMNNVDYQLKHINIRSGHLYNFPFWFPFGGRSKLKKAQKNLDDIIYEIISERRKSKKQYDDLLSIWLETKDEKGKGLSDKQLRDEIITMFFFGTESTAVAFASIIYLLVNHQQAETQLREEIKRVTGDGPFEIKHISKLPYARAIIEESLRLYPPAWLMGRLAVNNDSIGDYKIRKGDSVIISPYLMHHLDRYWNDPEHFQPERFIGDNRKKIKPYVYFPFGAGPRGCIGNHFAMMELHIMLVVFYQNFTFTESGNDMRINLGINFRPKNGVLVKPKLL